MAVDSSEINLAKGEKVANSSEILDFEGIKILCEYKNVERPWLELSLQKITLYVPLSCTKSEIFDTLKIFRSNIYKYADYNERKDEIEYERKIVNQDKTKFLGRIYEVKFDKKCKKVRVLPSAFLEGNSGEFTAFGEKSRKFTEKNSAFNEKFKQNSGEFTEGNSAFNENSSEFTQKNSAAQKDIKGVIIAPNKRALEAFLHANLTKITDYYIKKWRGHFEKDISGVSISKMMSCWGRCHTREGHIELNLRLITNPLKVIEYVVLHELTHLKFPHHKASFWAQIHALMPDYKTRILMYKSKWRLPRSAK